MVSPPPLTTFRCCRGMISDARQYACVKVECVKIFNLHQLCQSAFVFDMPVTDSCAGAVMLSCDSLPSLVDFAHMVGLVYPFRSGAENCEG